MSNCRVQSGQNLWNIVRDRYKLTNNTDIANKVNEIAKANHISNPNSIFAGQALSLPEATGTNTLGDSKGIASSTGSTTTTEEAKTTPLNDWTNACADSVVNPNKEVKPFDMVGDEFRNDIKNNGGAKAGEIYKQKALETAKGEIALFDENKDGAISLEEQVKGDKAAYEKKFGQLDPADESKAREMSLRANLFMDLNKDKKVDEKEYAAFLYAMDSNNKGDTANGQITRDEYTKTSSYFEQPLTDEAGTFRGKMRSCYKSFFGIDPKTQIKR